MAASRLESNLSGAYFAGMRLKPLVANSMNGRYTMASQDAGAIAECVSRCGGDYLEIGSLQGGSAIMAGLFARGNVYCVDIWGWAKGQTQEGPEPSPETVLMNTSAFGLSGIIPLTRAMGDETLPKEVPDEVDVSFIDGDHHYEWALADWLAVKDRTRRYVLFHDVHMDDEAHKAIEVLKMAADEPEWALVYQQAKMGIVERIR